MRPHHRTATWRQQKNPTVEAPEVQGQADNMDVSLDMKRASVELSDDAALGRFVRTRLNRPQSRLGAPY
eukprot:12300123-Karenia_brevis.AAC.1